ncbi:uncharacterized protein [Haliotis cracherodii]|uniref:uncharacterized protein n=1 Tax=Haliotis cracherodii TaxID=6455 RepID=UPI0039E8A63E
MSAANGDSRDCTTWSRSPSSSNSKRSYTAGVSDYEVDAMSLTAAVCRTVNGRMRKSYRKQSGKQNLLDYRNSMKANDAFFIKTGHMRFYGTSLAFSHDLNLTPTSLCPDADAHNALVRDYDLPLACPTCWSAQRNRQPTHSKVKVEKKKAKKSPICK